MTSEEPKTAISLIKNMKPFDSQPHVGVDTVQSSAYKLGQFTQYEILKFVTCHHWKIQIRMSQLFVSLRAVCQAKHFWGQTFSAAFSPK